MFNQRCRKNSCDRQWQHTMYARLTAVHRGGSSAGCDVSGRESLQSIYI